MRRCLMRKRVSWSKVTARNHRLRSDHLQYQQVPVHETLMAQGCTCVRVVILVEGAVQLEIGGEQRDGFVCKGASLRLEAVSLKPLPREVVNNDPHRPQPVAGVRAEGKRSEEHTSELQS